jgi:hypothetical protein
MLIYRFRITSDEHDDFLMEVDIQPSQTFKELHDCIVESAELLPADRAFIYPTDKKDVRGLEISLKSYKKEVKKYDPELDEMVNEIIIPRMMKDARIKNYIEDPHQRLVYLYHGKVDIVLKIELFKIVPSENMKVYPSCNRKQGTLPKLPVVPVIPEVVKQEKPKVAEPPIPLPTLASITKLDEIIEDDAELAEIDNEIGELLMEEAPVEAEVEEHNAGSEEETEESSFYDSDEEKMEHLEDFDNIENLEMRFSHYDGNQDD